MITSATTIETVTGRQIDLSNPNVSDISVEDIAWGLSRQARFAGHTITDIPYSVAQHSCYVADLVKNALTPGHPLSRVYEQFLNDHNTKIATSLNDAADQILISNQHWCESTITAAVFGALLHDASEAYLVDLPSPVKRLPGVYEAYSQVEARVMYCIYEAFNLPYRNKWPETKAACEFVIGWADLFARAVEAYHFMPSRGANWGLQKPTVAQLHSFRQPVPSLQAYLEFMVKFQDLRGSIL